MNLRGGNDDRVLQLAKWSTFLFVLEIDEEMEPENIWFELDEEDRSIWNIDYPGDMKRIMEITPEQYAQYVDMFYEIAEMADDQISIDNEWGSTIAMKIYEAMLEDQES